MLSSIEIREKVRRCTHVNDKLLSITCSRGRSSEFAVKPSYVQLEAMVEPLMSLTDSQRGPEAALVLQKMTDGATLKWHVVDRGTARTVCGLHIGYDTRRRLWTDTPEYQRCHSCSAFLLCTAATALNASTPYVGSSSDAEEAQPLHSATADGTP